ncbi:precorrin-2 dehydrogenase and sirohydrochlorin ferrochelatase, putative [Geotalea daltonii FRC-32]|uniref:precorrin-2 dehydrogenase n=2 Tax=Geotalea TaxID=2910589 RepID=B9M419_GEODF|nr:precorrin-2 dehydrogenase and sirohydrochlorin ferrochelatase, putative [Geotalea daltonii FRC-32]
MSFFPINLNMAGRMVTVVGGGKIAERKTCKLLEAGALITMIAPDLSDKLAKLSEGGSIKHLPRNFKKGDLDGAFLAIAATSDRYANLAVADEAKNRGILVDVCDDPELSSFIMPAMMTRGDLVIAVSTGGKSPAMAKKIREQLEASFGPEYEQTLKLLGILREKLLTAKGNSAYNKALLSQLAAHDLPRMIKERRYDQLDHLLLKIFGSEFSISHLLEEEKDHQ